ncbi:MAG: ABC transporter permease subunit [Methanocella sp.]
MRNTYIIAKNEFVNLLNSKLIFVVVAVYVILFIQGTISMRPPGDPIYTSTLANLHLIGIADSDYYTCALLYGVGYSLWVYGALFGVVLGVYTVASERYGKTLGNLVAKPLYRDTIINGKLIGCSMFILALFFITILLYTVYIMVCWGGAFLPLAGDYLIRLPIVAAAALIYVMFFFAIAMLISLVVKDLAFALIASMLIRQVLLNAVGGEISSKLALLSGIDFDQLRSIFPDIIIRSVFALPGERNNILIPSIDLLSAVSAAIPAMAILFVYVVILVVAGYIIFLRSDVS